MASTLERLREMERDMASGPRGDDQVMLPPPPATYVGILRGYIRLTEAAEQKLGRQCPERRCSTCPTCADLWMDLRAALDAPLEGADAD